MVSDKPPFLCQKIPMISLKAEMVWIWMQCRTECGKPSSAHVALVPIYKLVLGACLAFRFSEGHRGDAGRGSPVWNNLEEKERGEAESGRQNINGEDESPAWHWVSLLCSSYFLSTCRLLSCFACLPPHLLLSILWSEKAITQSNQAVRTFLGVWLSLCNSECPRLPAAELAQLGTGEVLKEFIFFSPSLLFLSI